MGVNYSMTVAEVADDLGCKKSFVQRLVGQKRLDAVINTKLIKNNKVTSKKRGKKPRRYKQG